MADYDEPSHFVAVPGLGWRLRDGRMVIAFVILPGLPPIAVLNDGSEVSLSAKQKAWPTNWQFPPIPDSDFPRSATAITTHGATGPDNPTVPTGPRRV